MATGKHNNIIVVVAATIIITCVCSHRVRRIIASALPVGMVFTFFYASIGRRWAVMNNDIVYRVRHNVVITT